MKVRMHEKAKKKTAEKYSVYQLLEKVTLTGYPQQRHDPDLPFHLNVVLNCDHPLHVCYIM